MDIVCENCGYVIENYNNIYGTYCRRCKHFIKPIDEPKFVKANKMKLEELRIKMLNKLRKIIKGVLK